MKASPDFFYSTRLLRATYAPAFLARGGLGIDPPLTHGRLAGIGAQDQRQLIEGIQVIFPPATHITYPRRKIRHGDQILTQPGVIYHPRAVHLACLTFAAGDEKFRGEHSIAVKLHG